MMLSSVAQSPMMKDGTLIVVSNPKEYPLEETVIPIVMESANNPKSLVDKICNNETI